MFVDQFSLSKNSWHARMMNYIWGFKTSDFSHICPYFWLSILNVIIFIPFAILKTFVRGLIVVLNRSTDLFDQKYDQWEKNYIKKLHNDPAELERFAGNVLCNKRFNRIWNKITSRFWSEGSYSAIYNKVTKLRADLEDKREEEKERRRLSNKQKINKINRIFKPFAQFIIGLAATASVMAVFYGIYLIIIYNPIKRINWREVLVILGISGIIIIGTIVIALGLRYIVEAIKKRSECGKSTWVGSFFTGIGKFFSICFQIIKNNCPAIKWED